MRKAKPYEVLSRFYAYLMRDIDYVAWAEYLRDIIAENIELPRVALELASGNGRLAALLAEKLDAKIFASDLSKEMLLFAPENLPKTVCDMRALPFASEFDLIFSAFDSVNYLTHPEDLLAFFSETAKILGDNGVLLFDVSLENNSLNNARFFNRSGNFGEIFFEQKSVYDEKKRIHTNEFVIKYDGFVYREKHEQKIYPFFDYFNFLEKAGLFVSACYDAFTFDDATPESERAQFVVRKAL